MLSPHAGTVDVRHDRPVLKSSLGRDPNPLAGLDEAGLAQIAGEEAIGGEPAGHLRQQHHDSPIPFRGIGSRRRPLGARHPRLSSLLDCHIYWRSRGLGDHLFSGIDGNPTRL